MKNPTIDQHATQAIQTANPGGFGGLRMQAIVWTRAAAGCGLAEAITAVDQALIDLITLADLEPHRQPSATGWRYEFPNNRAVIIRNDDAQPFRFEVISDDPADIDRGNIARGLTTEQVQKKLIDLYAMPCVEPV